jgi:hypothetical protein
MKSRWILLVGACVFVLCGTFTYGYQVAMADDGCGQLCCISYCECQGGVEWWGKPTSSGCNIELNCCDGRCHGVPCW